MRWSRITTSKVFDHADEFRVSSSTSATGSGDPVQHGFLAVGSHGRADFRDLLTFKSRMRDSDGDVPDGRRARDSRRSGATAAHALRCSSIRNHGAGHDVFDALVCGNRIVSTPGYKDEAMNCAFLVGWRQSRSDRREARSRSRLRLQRGCARRDARLR